MTAAATGLEHPAPAGPKPKTIRNRAGAAGAGLLALLAKGKALLLALTHVKLLLTAGSMVVSILAYASIWGFPFAFGFVALLLVHESGHVIQLRREGLPATAPVFIPFLGAAIWAKSLGDDALAEARVGLAGPILGSVGAAVCVGIWHATGNDIWRALAYTGFFLNLFNLIPVLPLDGGRAMAAMTPLMWFVGLAVLIAFAVIAFSPIFLVIVALGAFETWRRYQAYRHGSEAARAYYRVHPTDRVLIAAVYIALLALLAVGLHSTYFHQSL